MAVKSLLAAVVALALCLIASAAVAQEDEQGALLVIMDVSGSMDEDDGAGKTRIEGARAAVTDLVEAVPEGTPIGLRIYGGRYDSSNKAKGCEDTQLTVPIGPVESTGADITSKIEDATPLGFTPIGYSLQQAASDFDDEANRSIVLVSDGDDTCGDPDPCTVAERLSKDGIDVRVDTIGLAIEDNQQAQGQLECIAEATGGSFVEVADTDELTERLSQVSTRAIEGWSAEGKEVDGGPIVTDATVIEPGTTYLDDVVDGESRWYAFPADAGQDITVTMSEDGALDYGCCVELRLYEPDQETDFGREGGFTDGVPKIYRTGTREEGTKESGDYYVSVVLDDGNTEGELEYQLDVVVQGEADGADETATETESTDDADTTAPPEETTAEPTEPQEDETNASDAAEADDGNGLLLTLVILLGIAVVALAGGMAYLLIRMNRPSQ